MRDFLNDHFPTFPILTTGITVDLALRYGLLAGVAWVLGYVIFKRRWLHRKIVAHFPAGSEVRRELRYSLLSLIIFGFTGALTLWVARAGWTQVYWKVSDYGWGWFWGSVVCAVFLHDAYFYWTHRAMHHPRLFPWFHRAHHLSHNPTPWAAYAFDPLEAVVQALIFPLAVFLIPMHPLAFVIFMVWQLSFNVIGHSGYEIFRRWYMDTPLRYILN